MFYLIQFIIFLLFQFFFFVVVVPVNIKQLIDHHNAPGAPLGESLWKLPNRRFHPEYYTHVKKPISMAQIRNKLKKGEYVNITEMTADLYLMLDNAKKALPATHKVHKVRPFFLSKTIEKRFTEKLILNSL